MDKNRIIAASLLASDFSRIGEAVADINRSGSDWVHLDIMDGSFVPEITFGAQLVRQVGNLTDKTLDVHLMIDNPEKHIDRFAEAGSDYITIHYENTVHLNKYIEKIHDLGCRAGVALVPSTAPANLTEVLPYADLILVMTVDPGYGGQELILSCLKKVAYLSQIREKMGYNYLISIDGGVNRQTFKDISKTDVDILVTGSAFFQAEDKNSLVKFFKS